MPSLTQNGYERKTFTSSSAEKRKGLKVCDECNESSEWIIKLVNAKRGTINHALYLRGIRNYICVNCKKMLLEVDKNNEPPR